MVIARQHLHKEYSLGQSDLDATYLCSLLGSTGLSLGEGRRRGFLALFGRLSLRKEEYQRIAFTKQFPL